MSDPAFQAELQRRINAIKFAASSQEASNEKLKKDFLETKKSGIYNYLISIPTHSVFIYFIIFLLSFTILNEISFTGKHIIILISSLIVIFLLNEKRRSTTITRMQELEMKLNSIFPKPKNFHIDSGIVELIYSINEFKNYNVLAFNKLIRTLDDFLDLTLDIEKNPDNGFSLYDNLQNMKDASLNLLQSIIYNTPSELIAENKLDNATESLHYILNFHLEQIRLKTNEQYVKQGPNIKNKYIYSNKAPEGKDPYFNKNYDMF